MKVISFIALAVAASLVSSPPLLAAPHRSGGGGGGAHVAARAPHFSGGGGARFAARGAHFAARPAGTRVAAFHGGQHGAMPARNVAAASFRGRNSGFRGSPNVAAASFRGRNGGFRGSPSVAVGGHLPNQNNRFNGGSANRTLAGNSHPDWDHNSVHAWNRHHYRWDNGVWLDIDPGFGWGGGYPDGYGYYPDTTMYQPSGVYGGSVDVAVQQQLAQDGYYNGPVDGVIGPRTHQAIAAYQADNGLPQTGAIDQPLLNSLGL